MRWGLIGASRIAASQMIGAIRASRGDIVSVLSSDPQRGRAYADQHGIADVQSDLEAMLQGGLDAVYISTTNEKHLPQGLAAIEAGCHVLCEKPLAMNVADARRLVDAARAKGVTFGTNHHLRCMGVHRRIREIVQGGDLGEVLSVRVFHAVELPEELRGWRLYAPDAGGGVIADITVHDADTVRFHLGEDPVEVVAIAGTQGMGGKGVEDGCMSVWQMPSGAMVQDHVSFTHPFAGNGIEIHGAQGSIKAQGAMSVMWLEGGSTFDLIGPSGASAIEAPGGSPYPYSAERFAAACRGEGAPAATGEDGVASLAVAAAVAEAARDGRRTKVDYAR